MVYTITAGTGANKGFWQVQLRDRFGKFVEMGGAVLFDINIPGVIGKVHAVGVYIGSAEPGVGRIEVTDNKKIPKGVYLVKSEDLTAIEAILPEEALEPRPPAESLLKKSMSGSEALDLRLRSMGNLLREDGRFPVPRMAYVYREDSDNRRAAKRDYKKVFDAEPALQEKYKTYENMWEQVHNYGTDERTQSPNELASIPEDMKELNRAYAKHFLGLDPEGLITVYRNAVNGKFTEEESAVGYASTDALMAYDYASHRDNIEANGRYEIDVKPGEIFGMLGYSKIEDEYGVTIGRELANIPGRVRRVGDLGLVLPEAPWLKEWGLNFNRGKGASPFRQYSLAVSHDFHPVEPFGDSVAEFLTKYNISAGDIKIKFDELYGEGAYEKYKATGNVVDFNKLKRFFVPLPDGKIGLDVEKLSNIMGLGEVSEYTGDIYDNTMKMLSVIQEITGQYFMTHRTRGYTPTEVPSNSAPEGETLGDPAEPTVPKPEIIYDKFKSQLKSPFMSSDVMAESQSPEVSDWVKAHFTSDKTLTPEMKKIRANYIIEDDNTIRINKELRDGIETDLDIKGLDTWTTSESVTNPIRVYRGLILSSEIHEKYQVGSKFVDKAYSSVAVNRNQILHYFMVRKNAGAAGDQVEFRINLDVGQPMGIADMGEIVLPRNSEFEVLKRTETEPGRIVLEIRPLPLADTAEEETPEDTSTMYGEFFDGGMVDLRALRNSGSRVSPYDLEMFSEDQLAALGEYGQAGHRWINKILRGGEPISADNQKLIDNIDAAIEENGEVFSAARIFRGDTPSQSSDYYKFLEGLTEGKVINLPGYFSASNDSQIAFSEFGPGQGGSDDDASNSHLGSTFFWTIDIPENGKAMGMPEGVGFGQGVESEVLLPRNTEIKIIGIKKVEQIDDEGQPTGEFNYFIHAEQLPA